MVITCVECLVRMRAEVRHESNINWIGCCSVCFGYMMARLRIDPKDSKAKAIARLYEPDDLKWEKLLSR